MKKEIKKIVIDNEEVYMRKSYDGWRVIYPIKNEDGSINKKNLLLGGNVFIFLRMIIICAIIIGFLLFYYYNLNSCADTIKEHIMQLCQSYQQSLMSSNSSLEDLINLTISNVKR